MQGERAEVSGLRVERTSDFGGSYLGLALWHRLERDGLSRGAPARRSRVGRVVARGGAAHRRALLRATLGTGRGRAWVCTTDHLDDSLGVDTGLVNDARLSRALDQLGARKDALRAHPMTRYRE